MRFKKNKRALSSIIITFLMILLTLFLVGTLYAIINPLVQKNLKKSSICLELMDKIDLSDSETCYNLTSKKLFFMVDVKDTDKIDRADIVISNNQTQKSITLTNALQSITNLTYYDNSDPVKLPEKKAGRLYNYTWSDPNNFPPTKIEIIPSLEGYTCSGSDMIPEIPLCAS